MRRLSVQPESETPMYANARVFGSGSGVLEPRFFALRRSHSTRRHWFAIVLAASALSVMLVASIRAHEHERATGVSHRFRPYTLSLADRTVPTTESASRSGAATHSTLIARQSTELLATLGN